MPILQSNVTSVRQCFHIKNRSKQLWSCAWQKMDWSAGLSSASVKCTSGRLVVTPIMANLHSMQRDLMQTAKLAACSNTQICGTGKGGHNRGGVSSLG